MTPEELKSLVESVHDQDSLLALLRDGLAWDLRSEFTLEDSPEIAQGVKGTPCKVYELVGAFENRLAFVVEFDEAYVRRDLRELLTSLRKLIRDKAKFAGIDGHGDTIFIVTTPGYEDVRFVLFEQQEKRLPKIRSFGWRKKFAGRTVLTHNLTHLGWANQTRWQEAWNVEALTDKFYDDLVSTFDQIKLLAIHPGGDVANNSYVQQLLNRLLFIAFIERFEWLKTPDGDSDYLHAIWKRFKAQPTPATYYKSLDLPTLDTPTTFLGELGLLFFKGLDDQRVKGIEPGHELFPLLGHVPYLNGGLFSEEAGLDVPGVTVEDRAFGLLFDDGTGLFRRYNFTVTESTPLDQEVAVDPEMLGKIFERLIIAEERHRTGTYYTPRPIVEFMVNESLKAYLVRRGLDSHKAALLVDRGERKDLESGIILDGDDLQNVSDWLLDLRAVDPACGSGAYLLLLLQRVFDLVDRVQVVAGKGRNGPEVQHQLYELKLRILERCIYGVDLNETAVRIARLRLWLSLVVENKGTKPEPLPSFDFLIMQGDALASPVGLDHRTLAFPHDAIRDYARLKHRYFHPKLGEARPTRKEMEEARAKIAEYFEGELDSPLRKAAKKPFDWEVDFAEVFNPDDAEDTMVGNLNLGHSELPVSAARHSGFDIVLANPPYVNSGELLRSAGTEYKTALVAGYPNSGTGTADLLVFFLDRATQLLAVGGQLAFITSNKWLKAAYGTKIRSWLAKRTDVEFLIDFRDLPVFQGTIAYPLITLAQKRKEVRRNRGLQAVLDGHQAQFVNVPSLNAPYPDVRLMVFELGLPLEPDALGTDGEWRMESGDAAGRLATMRTRGIKLGDYVKGKIFYGIKTGLNEVKIGSDGKMYGKIVPKGVRVVRKEGVFVIDGARRAELIAEDPKSVEIIKPLIIGRDVKRWVVENNDRWLIVTKIGTDMSRYPAVMKHLEKYEERLVPRADQGVHYWELRACAYYDEFESKKLVWGNLNDKPTFAYAPAGSYVNAPAVMCPSADLFLLGALNSRAFWSLLTDLAYSRGGGFYETKPVFLNPIPIPEASPAVRSNVEGLVSQILRKKEASSEADVTSLEKQLDDIFEELYFGRPGSTAVAQATYDTLVAALADKNIDAHIRQEEGGRVFGILVAPQFEGLEPNERAVRVEELCGEILNGDLTGLGLVVAMSPAEYEGAGSPEF